jgi:hypothetical protein
MAFNKFFLVLGIIYLICKLSYSQEGSNMVNTLKIKESYVDIAAARSKRSLYQGELTKYIQFIFF